MIIALSVVSAYADPPTQGLLPDLQTVVPQQLQLKNENGGEWLRFSNGVANTGEGPLRLRPELDPATGEQLGIQEVLDADGNIVDEYEASRFDFHPEHNHWHIDDVALYELRSGSPTGPIVGGISVKTTFCLIDWYALEGNSPTSEREYWDCATSYQGISPGWVDQYHHSLPGQGVDVTNVPDGTYYLVSTANPEGHFVESDLTNNTAWVQVSLTRPNNKRKLTILSTSPCDSPGMCGEFAPNR